MAFSSTLTLDDASGDDVEYVLVKTNSDGTSRIDVASSIALPGLLNIKHSASGKNGDAVDRHLVQLSRVVPASPAPVTVVVNMTLAIPRNAAVTPEIVYNLVANLLDFSMSGNFSSFMSTTNLDALLRGES